MSRVLCIVGRVNMSRFVNGGLSMNWHVIGGVSMSRVLCIVWRVNMSRFVNGGLSMNWHVIRVGAVNKGIESIVVGCVIRAGAVNKGIELIIVGCVIRAMLVNRGIIGHVSKSCCGAKKGVVIVSVGRSVVW